MSLLLSLYLQISNFCLTGSHIIPKPNCLVPVQADYKPPFTSPNVRADMDRRSRTVSTISETVTGVYDLYDSLHITTVSGSIDIVVNPHPAAQQHPNKPAELYVKSVSGTIRVQVSGIPGSVPNRTYTTHLKTTSGSVHATLLHGVSTKISTTSGSNHIDLYPFTGPGANATTSRSDISISSQSGSSHIRLYPSLNHPSESIRNLYGSYSHQSGSLDLTYPLNWEGTITGSTSSGGITCSWPGLDIMRSGNAFSAIKGGGTGVLTFDGTSGPTKLLGEGGEAAERNVKDEEDEAMRVQSPANFHGAVGGREVGVR